MSQEYDLIVVGYGAAGAAAAITAAQSGARVAIIEKQPQDKHYSSTRMSGGLIMGANDVETATRYLDACAEGMIPTSVNRAWAERAVRLPQWLRSVGIESVVMAGGWHPQLDGFESIDVFAPLPRGVDPASVEVELPPPGELRFKFPLPYGNGDMLHEQLLEAVDKEKSIDCFFGHAAKRLLREDDRINGLVCSSDGGEVIFKTKHGVVLACGGFEQDQDMILNYLKAYPIYFYGSKANTGDGIRMAQAVGADLWHMNQMIGRAVMRVAHPDGWESTFSPSLNPPGYAILDKHGRRFANEHLQAVSKAHFYYELLQYDAEELGYPRIPAYWVFDKKRLEARAIAHGGLGYYQWSKDNRQEIDLGWIKEGATIAEAARAAGMLDPEEAERTISDYNNACTSGVDIHGRPADSLIPIDEPPYYCVPVYPGGATTNGGPRRDEKARILDAFGDPIPGLFGAGELGGAIGVLYPSPGANLGEALAFGAIAAETALSANQ
ncbi:MAG: FAD-binding protein [Parvularculaceae bacterium]|nr:FAD-binding protein [Parvularculaceae bacterium]